MGPKAAVRRGDDVLPPNAPPVTPDEALELIRSGRLVDEIKPRLTTDAPSSLALAVRDLHNADRTDVLEIAESPAVQAVQGHSAYQIELFFGDILSELTLDTPRMLRLVQALEAPQGGTGFGAAQKGFRLWLDADRDRALEVLRLVEAGQASAAYVSLALQSLGDLAEARRLARSTDGVLLSAALHALAWIPHGDAKTLAGTLEALSAAAEDPADDVRGAVLRSLLGVFERAKATLTDEARALIDRLLTTPAPLTAREAARALLTDPPTLDAPLIRQLLESQANITAEEGARIQALDLGLHRLVDLDHADLVIDFLVRLVGPSEADIPLSAFELVIPGMVAKPAMLDRLLVRGLLTEGPLFGRGLSRALPQKTASLFGGQALLAAAAFSDDRLHALCMRAIGHLYFHPVLAASVLAGVLRIAQPELAEAVEELLFDPLLLNYGGDLQTYLEQIAPPDLAHVGVRRALDRKAAYLKGLEATASFKELRPPEGHRQAEYDKHSDEMRRSYDAARAASPLLGLIHTTVVLYGRSTTSVMIGPDGRRHLSDNRMASHSTSFEVPRGSVLDPFGLEEMLLIFQSWDIPA